MTRKQLVHALAQLVVKSNLENYKDVCAGAVIMTSSEFAEFGTNPETVTAIIRDLVVEVSEEVESIQKLIGPILFD
ncbi:MAG: hypothetical protein EO766_17820 [Hydrotalea sp. AMD]|uniref:hypothetical protein n=1 Tax=Hydrotalea sp. AMD TaxID=2501297 RepID=UPI00102686CA|nr:hypothetical protein [Hydrotalea sp. AMD]RWZ83184.1 MAG: hypothetical protein EO766_17820 [Hydrotalea sp. AMD]